MNVKLQSRVSDFTSQLEAFILPQIVSPQPSQYLYVVLWHIPKNISLAKPHFNQPQRIDVLLGAQFYHQLLSIGKIHLGDHLPSMQNTVFGWVFAGRVTKHTSENATCRMSTFDDDNLQHIVERFWSLEEVSPTQGKLSKNEELCEAQFTQNTWTVYCKITISKEAIESR